MCSLYEPIGARPRQIQIFMIYMGLMVFLLTVRRAEMILFGGCALIYDFVVLGQFFEIQLKRLLKCNP